MYREEPEEQQEIQDFYLPFGGHLDETNRWVILSKRIPWDKVERDYRDVTHTAFIAYSKKRRPSTSVRRKAGTQG